MHFYIPICFHNFRYTRERKFYSDRGPKDQALEEENDKKEEKHEPNTPGENINDSEDKNVQDKSMRDLPVTEKKCGAMTAKSRKVARKFECERHCGLATRHLLCPDETLEIIKDITDFENAVRFPLKESNVQDKSMRDLPVTEKKCGAMTAKSRFDARKFECENHCGLATRHLLCPDELLEPPKKCIRMS